MIVLWILNYLILLICWFCLIPHRKVLQFLQVEVSLKFKNYKLLGFRMLQNLQSCLSMLYWCSCSCYLNIEWVGRCLSVTPVNQLQRQLGVRTCSRWCCTWSGFDVFAKKNRLALNVHLELLYIIESAKMILKV